MSTELTGTTVHNSSNVRATQVSGKQLILVYIMDDTIQLAFCGLGVQLFF